jgi:hypothetical protein
MASRRADLTPDGLVDVHHSSWNAEGNGTADDGAVLRAALKSVDNNYPVGIGGGIQLGHGRVYRVGADSNGVGLDISPYSGLRIKGGCGTSHTDMGDIGCTIRAGTNGMTLLKQGDRTFLNHNGASIEHLNLSDGGLSNVVLHHLHDQNHCEFRKIHYVGAGAGCRGLICDQLSPNGDLAYNWFNQCDFRFTHGSAVRAVEIIRTFGLHFRGCNFDMPQGVEGMRIRNWSQSVFLHQNKWNHAGKHIISEGGRLLITENEFEHTSPTDWAVQILKSATSPSPFSGHYILVRSNKFVGNSGDERGLRIGRGVVGADDDNLFSNYGNGVPFKNESVGTWQHGRVF